MRKGVIFTLDALVAVVIAVMALAILMQMVSLKTGEWYKEIALYNSAQDILTSKDKDGTLGSIFGTSDAVAVYNLNNSIASQLPSNMVARMNVSVYNYQSNSFVCVRNLTAGQSGTTPIKSVVRRVFTDPPNNNYSVVVMEVWYR